MITVQHMVNGDVSTTNTLGETVQLQHYCVGSHERREAIIKEDKDKFRFII